MKITIFGDSITNGYGQEPSILADLLPDYTVKLHGANGDDTSTAHLRVKYVADENADLNFIFFGANDASPHVFVSPQDFASNLTGLVRHLTAEKSVIISPPWYSESDPTHYSSLERVRKFTEVARQVAETLDTGFIDLCQAMENAVRPADLVQLDGLHFTKAGYELLSGLINQYIKERN